MELIIPSLDEIGAAAQQFIEALGGRTVVAFYGAMGAGKTTFIKAICEALGVEDVITSPTFSIINEYSSERETIYHFDLYRLKRLEEFLDIGGEDYLFSGKLCLIEWPELIEGLLSEEAVRATIMVEADGSRVVRM